MRKRIALVVVALIAAYLVKRYYSTAGAGELRFILAPTAWLVSLATGAHFRDAPEGWVSDELRFVIAPSCAGVNFLLVAFVALTLAFVRSWRALALAAGASFAATLCANTLRIAVAIALHVHHVSWGWLDEARLHRLEGVAVYLVMLLGLFAVARRVAGGGRLLVPLACYFGMTLVIPLLRGAWARPEFWEHAAVVAGIVGLGAAAFHLKRRAFDL